MSTSGQDHGVAVSPGGTDRNLQREGKNKPTTRDGNLEATEYHKGSGNLGETFHRTTTGSQIGGRSVKDGPESV
jgi:hypothetical protein